MTMSESSPSNSDDNARQSSTFGTTQWTQVLASRGDSSESKAALCDLCEAYYSPAYSFVRNRIGNDQEARDLTHDFIASLLAGNPFRNLDRRQTRFRSYLLGTLKHFLTDAIRAKRRIKRGGGLGDEPLADEHPPESGIGVSVSQKAPEDVIYDKQWALIVMNRALERLEEEFVKSEKQSLFDILKPWLVGETEGLSQKSAAEQLETNEGAVKVAIHRMRKKFRQILKNEIAKTLDIEADVKQELNYLVEVLSQ